MDQLKETTVGWVLSVIEETKLKIDIIQLLSLSHPSTLIALLGEDFESSIHQYVAMASTKQRRNTQSLDFDHTEEELDMSQFKSLFNVICRKIKNIDPNLWQHMINSERSNNNEGIVELCSNINMLLELRKGEFMSLAASDDFRSAEQQHGSLVQLFQSAQRRTNDLQGQLSSDRDDRFTTKESLHSAITKLQNTIETLNEVIQREDASMNHYLQSETANIQETHEKIRGKRQTELEKLTEKLVEARAMHKDMEIDLKKKVKRAENEIDELRLKYDNDMMELHSQIQSITGLYNLESKRLVEMKEGHAALVEEREAHERELAEKKAQEEAERQRINDAAVQIQKIWRGHQTRSALAKDGKGKKKKK